MEFSVPPLIAPSGEAIDWPESQPRHLSPSSSTLYQECPRKWKHRYVDKLPDPPGIPALAGTFAHRVLELLLQEPAQNRTVERARDLARQAWPEIAEHEEYHALGLSDADARAFRWRGWLAIEGLWKIEDPCDVAVHATEQDVRVEVNGVPFRGIIDRVDVEADGLVVADYKSGVAPSARFRDERLNQVLLYAAALAELTGQRPVRARLLYLGQKIIEVAVDDETLEEPVERLAETWASLLADCERGVFETRTGPLCGWCPYLAGCPEGQAEVRFRWKNGRIRPDAPGLQVVAEAS